jgi:hypothetical protein
MAKGQQLELVNGKAGGGEGVGDGGAYLALDRDRDGQGRSPSPEPGSPAQGSPGPLLPHGSQQQPPPTPLDVPRKEGQSLLDTLRFTSELVGATRAALACWSSMAGSSAFIS